MSSHVKDYRSFISHFRDWKDQFKKKETPRLSLFFSLEPIFEIHICHLLKSSKIKPKWFEAADINLDSLAKMQQVSMFEKTYLVIIKNANQQTIKTIAKLKPEDIVHTTVIFFPDIACTQSIQKELNHLMAWSISQPKFRNFEMISIIKDLAANYNLLLNAEALNFLAQLQIPLCQLDNEFRKISILTSSLPSQPISINQLEEWINIIPNQSAFELDRLLASSLFSKAQKLLIERLNHGDSVIALLGIVARHCRNFLKIAEFLHKNLSLEHIAQQLRIPLSAIKGYNLSNIQISEDSYKVALKMCQQADILAKTTNIAPDLLIGEIIAYLELQHVNS